MWVVEYSGSQDCFHVEEKKIILEKNKTNMLKGKSNDYQIIAECENQKLAEVLVLQF